MKNWLYLAVSFVLICTAAPQTVGANEDVRTETKPTYQAKPKAERVVPAEPARSSKPAKPVSAKKPRQTEPKEAASPNRPPPDGPPDTDVVTSRPRTYQAPDNVLELPSPPPGADDFDPAAGQSGLPEPGKLGLEDDAGSIDALSGDDMDALIVVPATAGADEPGIEGDDPTETRGSGPGLDLIPFTGAVDPEEMGGLDSSSQGAGELRDCVLGECDDGKVTTAAPAAGAGDPINPDGGWTDPPGEGGDAGSGDPGRGDINPCALDATCETGDETTGQEGATPEEDEECDDSSSDPERRCTQTADQPDTGESVQHEDSVTHSDSDTDTTESDSTGAGKSQRNVSYGDQAWYNYWCAQPGWEGGCTQGGDADSDGLTNDEERRSLTDPTAFDTDGDGEHDYLEHVIGSDPLNPASTTQDLDGDGLSNLLEKALGTSEDDWDSDNDGVIDSLDTDPLDPHSDTDGDGFEDFIETAWGSDPEDADSTVCDVKPAAGSSGSHAAYYQSNCRK